MVIFWEAPERVIEHFLDRMPRDFRPKYASFGTSLFRNKYFYDYYSKLLRLFGLCYQHERKILAALRPVMTPNLSRLCNDWGDSLNYVANTSINLVYISGLLIARGMVWSMLTISKLA